MSSRHPYRRFMPLLDGRNRALVVEVKLENDDGKLALVSVGVGKERRDHLTTVRSLFEDKHDAWCEARRMSAKKRGVFRTCAICIAIAASVVTQCEVVCFLPQGRVSSKKVAEQRPILYVSDTAITADDS